MIPHGSRSTQGFLNQAEDYADLVLRRSKTFLPHIARLCLLSTFIEDGFRMWFQWGPQVEFFTSHWGVHYIFGALFVIINMLAQGAGCGMVIARKHVQYACGVLVFVVVIQTVGYGILFEPYFLMRNMALLGGILLLLAESQTEQGRTLFAGLPSMGENKTREYMQLGGRVLLLLMFLTIIRFEVSAIHMIQTVGGLVLMLLVAIGYKTKLCSLVLVAWLFAMNVYYNAFWQFSVQKAIFDYLKYDFFQTCSVIGGLLMLIALGPGGVSFDERKKNW